MLGADLTANLIGAIGFAAYLASPSLPTRRGMLLLDAVAMIPIAIHYLMLGGFVGAVMSGVYLIADLAGLTRDKFRNMLVAAIAIAASAYIVLQWQAISDLAPLAGTLLFLASRVVRSHAQTLMLAGMATLPWGIYGFLFDSLSQVIFSAIYCASCAVRLYRLPKSA